MADKWEDFTVTCQGGMDNKNTFLELSSVTPGAATRLINFEPGLYGGYRRIDGFQFLSDTYDEVDPTNAEGPILGVFIFDDDIYAARKQKAGNTYKIYSFDAGTGWSALSPGFTLNTVNGSYNIARVEYEVFNFRGTKTIIFVDGVNYAYMFDGSSWTQIKSTNTGANYANAGGPNALDQPSVVSVYQGHLFISGDPAAPQAIAHCAPKTEYDWLTASGAGQVVPGFEVLKTKVWRDDMIVFNQERISRVTVSGTDFVVRDVTTNLGCLSAGSVVEVNGDLMFLSQDGLRKIAGTDKIDDFELGTVSRKIQKTVKELSDTYTNQDITAVTLRKKNQVRFFFNSSGVSTPDTRGIIGGYRENIQGEPSWEWGELLGIQAWVVTSGFVNDNEYILHGDYNGFVFRQEQGSSFNGEIIAATYRTPYLDFGAPLIRKTMGKIYAFIEPEGDVNISCTVSYDWRSPNVLNPEGLSLESDATLAAIYGSSTVTYGGTGIIYGGGIYPVLEENIPGSCFSIQLTFTTTGTEESYAIQTLLYEFRPQGRR